MIKLYKSQKPHECRCNELTLYLLIVLLYLMVLLPVVGSIKAFASSTDFGRYSYRKCYVTNISNRTLTVHIWKLLTSDVFSDHVINVSDFVIYPSNMQLIIQLRLPACTFTDVSYGAWYSPIYAPNTMEFHLEKGEYLLSMGCVDVSGKLDWWKTRFKIGEDTGLPAEIYISEFFVDAGKNFSFHPSIPLGAIFIERRANPLSLPGPVG